MFEKTVAVNLVGTFNSIQAGGGRHGSEPSPSKTDERGAIVNTASVAAFDGQVGQAAYSASKGGVAALTLPVARDLASRGIRVNTIAPGIIDTPLLAGLPEPARISLGQQVLHPARLGTPAEYAELAAVLDHPQLHERRDSAHGRRHPDGSEMTGASSRSRGSTRVPSSRRPPSCAGDVVIGPKAVIMFGAVLRAELDRVEIGAMTNVPGQRGPARRRGHSVRRSVNG